MTTIKTMILLGHEIKVFNIGGTKYLNQTDVALVIGKADNSALRFADSKAFKLNHDKGFQPYKKHSIGNITYNLLLPSVTTEYWSYWAERGNADALKLIIALAKEGLDTRLDVTFDDLTKQSVIDRITKTEEQLATEEREASRREHNAFVAICDKYHLPGNHTHDYLTNLVFGYTAQQARENLPLTEYSAMVWRDETVGINHHADPLLQKVMRSCKLAFVGYRKGTYKERCDRAFMEVTDDILLG